MNEAISAGTSESALRGRGMGTLVCAAFAAFWAISSRPIWPTSFVPAGLVAIALITAALIVAGIVLLRRARHASPALAVTGRPRRTGLRFAAIVAVEVIAMNIAAYVLVGHHLETYLIPAIAIIVGLHFFPLAQLFRARRYHLTAALMTVAGVAGAVAIAVGQSPGPVVALVDIACAVTLWLTGFASYVSTVRYGR